MTADQLDGSINAVGRDVEGGLGRFERQSGSLNPLMPDRIAGSPPLLDHVRYAAAGFCRKIRRLML
jgi:hypothetical protein